MNESDLRSDVHYLGSSERRRSRKFDENVRIIFGNGREKNQKGKKDTKGKQG